MTPCAASTPADPAAPWAEPASPDQVEDLIAQIDARISAQINLILHHPAFQRLESAWRGLKFLADRTETDAMLKIRCFSISKDELARTLRRFKGIAWDQSPLFHRIYSEEFGQLGGQPFGCLVGDYVFDHTPPDVDLLGELAKTAAAAHVPFIAGASPALLQMETWRELNGRRDLARLLTAAEYTAWRSLRETEDARYLALALPRFLARLPYHPRTQPLASFHFEEDTVGAPQDPFLWCNAAFAMAANVARSFTRYGWACSIRGMDGGGVLDDLPEHRFPSADGHVDGRCVTEVAITDRREAELSRAGLMPLVHIRNTRQAFFVGAQSLHKPAEFADPHASANAALGARLPYLFATCRFAHYLKCLVRDKAGSFADRAALQRFLNNWIMDYVDRNPSGSTLATRARKPLAAAEIEIEEVPEQPGTYLSRFFLRPHYQLEGMSVALRLLSRLPAGTA